MVSSGQEGLSPRVADNLRKESMIKSMILQPTEFSMRQADDTPTSHFMLSALLCGGFKPLHEVDEVLLNREAYQHRFTDVKQNTIQNGTADESPSKLRRTEGLPVIFLAIT